MINGVATELISVRDRGFQYGDGCFETLRLINHHPLLLGKHIERLNRTCQLLQIQFDPETLQTELSNFIHNCTPSGVIKIILTRGIGGRGYSATKNVIANRILQYTEYPDKYSGLADLGVCVGISKMRLSENSALAGHKHLNRLDQVLASFDVRGDLDEVLCMDSSGYVIEGTKSNIVIVREGEVLTPDLNVAGVNGVMLNYIRQQFKDAGIEIKDRNLTLEEVKTASEVFLCNSVFGVWPVKKIVEHESVKMWQIGPVTLKALSCHRELLASVG